MFDRIVTEAIIDRCFYKTGVLNPFHATGTFLYPLKTSENRGFCDVFRWYRKIPWHEMG